ncbi:MAG TPA: CpsD/CapB family tyrosine-protein kinase [Terriglobales bacterium]|nr:CpsD/CapB family tyrosine-protein kinase [Terriglobales bacterium]
MSRIREALLRAEQERSKGDYNEALASLIGPADDLVELSTTPAESAVDPASILAAAPGNRDVVFEKAGDGDQTGGALSRVRHEEWFPAGTVCLNFESRDAVGTEEFRTLRSRLKHLAQKKPLKRLLISSTLPGEGKTFVAVNLAQVIAQQYGTRVLLIDADLRRPTVHIALGAPQRPGLTDYLSDNKLDEFQVLQTGSIPNLYLISAGKPSHHSTERLSGDRLGKLLAKVNDLFDWIIIDSPPALGLSDTSTISSVCDGVIMVAAAGSTPYALAQKAQREFPVCPILGVILNRVDASQTYGKYYYNYQSRGENVKESGLSGGS